MIRRTATTAIALSSLAVPAGNQVVRLLPALNLQRPQAEEGLRIIEAVVAQGAIEVTLLGQNVNAYGVEFGERDAFADLLRACGGIAGRRSSGLVPAKRRRLSVTSAEEMRKSFVSIAEVAPLESVRTSESGNPSVPFGPFCER